jgi:hypothetical protein
MTGLDGRIVAPLVESSADDLCRRSSLKATTHASRRVAQSASAKGLTFLFFDRKLFIGLILGQDLNTGHGKGNKAT